MKRAILLALGILVLYGAQAIAGERLVREPRTYPEGTQHWRGEKGRKYVRRMSLRENLTNDKLFIYDKLGYTPHRLAFRFAGERSERWIYYGLGLEYWFDEEGRLVETRHFPPEPNHID
jgi:hypothetical protein